MKNLTRLLFLLLPLIPLLPGAASAQTTTLQVFEISGSDWLQGLRSPDTSGQSLGSGEIRFPAWEGSPFSFSAGSNFSGGSSLDSDGLEITGAGSPVMVMALAQGLRNTAEAGDRLEWVEFEISGFDPAEGALTLDSPADGIFVSNDTGLSYSTAAGGGVPRGGSITSLTSGAGGLLRIYPTGPLVPRSSQLVEMRWGSGSAGSALRIEAVRFGIETTAVPEPSAALLGLGAAAGMLMRRRRTVTV